MTIYLLRHAIAVPRGTPGYPGDDRPLTKEGRRKMKRNARGLRALEIGVETVFHSPLSRASETARIVVETLGLRCPVVETKALLPESDVGAATALLKKEKHGSVMLVGHEPHLGLLAGALAGAGEGTFAFRKGGIARIETDDPSKGGGRVDWVLTPRHLRLIGG